MAEIVRLFAAEDEKETKTDLLAYLADATVTGICNLPIPDDEKKTALMKFLGTKKDPQNDALKTLTNLVYTLVKDSANNKLLYLNPWTSSKRSEGEQEDFKDALIDYYQCSASENKVKCMVSQQVFPKNEVRASHIWKRATGGKGLEEFGLSPEDVDDVRNGLLMHKQLENAFDSREACFLYDPFKQRLVFVLLKPKEHCAPLLAQCHLKELLLPPGKFPFRRVLNHHARLTYLNAKKRGWVGTDYYVEDYFDLSDDASLNQDGLPGDFVKERQPPRPFDPKTDAKPYPGIAQRRKKRKEVGMAFKEGDVVEASWKKDSQWYRAKILGKDTQQLMYTVQFEIDGSKQLTPNKFVRKVRA